MQSKGSTVRSVLFLIPPRKTGGPAEGRVPGKAVGRAAGGVPYKARDTTPLTAVCGMWGYGGRRGDGKNEKGKSEQGCCAPSPSRSGQRGGEGGSLSGGSCRLRPARPSLGCAGCVPGSRGRCLFRGCAGHQGGRCIADASWHGRPTRWCLHPGIPAAGKAARPLGCPCPRAVPRAACPPPCG